MEKLVITKINSLLQLDELRNDWEKIHFADSQANIFNSWHWFKAWAEKTKLEWVVIAVKKLTDSVYISFLPLCYDKKKVIGFYTIQQLYYGGKYYSNYNNFLCMPEQEGQVISELAKYLQHTLSWEELSLRWVRDKRVEAFVNNFPTSKFTISLKSSLTSLVVNLPDSYELFLSHNMGRSTRRKTKEKVKFIQNSDQYHLKESTKETINEDIEILNRFWNNRWHKKDELEWYTHFMKYFDQHNLLRLTTLYFGDTPIAALSCIPDPANKIYNAYLTAYDPQYAHVSPGIVLFAESIKNAIEKNFKFYDLTVGLDYYKLSFSPQQIETKNLRITRKGIRTSLLKGKSKLIKLLRKRV